MDPDFWSENNNNNNNKTKIDKIAKIVSEGVCKTQRLVYTLHGTKSKTKKKLEIFSGSFNIENQELYTKPGEIVIIEGPKSRSYCLDGLVRNTVVFKGKINHVMIRNCDDVRIYLNNGTISGIDILDGSNVSVRTPKHNFTNVEHSVHANLDGTVDTNTLIHVTKSMDVFVNRKNLKVNCFVREALKLVYKNDEENERIDIGELSSSPPTSFNEIPTKLMLMGNMI